MNHEQQPHERREQNAGHEDCVTPQIWIGSLSDYNAGILYGDWLDASRDADDVRADIAALLAASPTARREGVPAEEFGIFDYEGFGAARVHEYDPIDQVCALACGIAAHGLAYAAWVSLGDQLGDQLGDRLGDELPEDHTSERFEDAYLGHFDSVVEYIEQFVDDMAYDQLLDEVVPAAIRPYVQIDVAGFARDLQLSGDVTSVADAAGSGIWLFESAAT